MAAKKPSVTVDPYGMNAMFERAAVTLACTNTRFFGVVGRHLEPAALGSPAARDALLAAQAIGAETGNGPGSGMLVVQRLSRWMQEGKVALEQILAVSQMLDDAEDAGLPPETGVASELVPMLQRRKQQDVLREMMQEYANRGDFAKVAQLLADCQRLGKENSDAGTRFTTSLGFLDDLKTADKFIMGVVGLDDALDGGLWRGGLGCVVGSTGAGKSMFLSHAAAQAMVTGYNVAYATLELSIPLVRVRLAANISGIPISSILSDKTSRDVAESRLTALETCFGMLHIQHFTPMLATVDDIKAWIDTCEKTSERKVDLVCIDYADKLTATVGKDATEYRTMRTVYEGLRAFADEKKHWCWTAAQMKGKKDKKKHTADADDAADSMHKGRIADILLTANTRGDHGEEILWNVAKNREGRSNVVWGPAPHQFEIGRIADTERVHDIASLFMDLAAETKLRGNSPSQPS